MRKFGFTLAEVLITLSIVGVISAMVLPSLNSNHQQRAIATATSRMYTNLQEAVSRYMVDNNIDNMDDVKFDGADFVKKYFKIVNECSEPYECFADSYRGLTNRESGITLSDGRPSFILNDGMSIQVGNTRGVYVDVNGKKGPNIRNRDMWVVYIEDNGSIIDIDQRSVANPFSSDSIERLFAECLNGNPYGCFGHFVKNGFKFDY